MYVYVCYQKVTTLITEFAQYSIRHNIEGILVINLVCPIIHALVYILLVNVPVNKSQPLSMPCHQSLHMIMYYFFFQMATMVYAEVSVPQKFHPHVIGKKGASINKIKEETCTSISIPSDKEKSDIIRIEGDPQGVAAAKKIIIDMAAKLVG